MNIIWNFPQIEKNSVIEKTENTKNKVTICNKFKWLKKTLDIKIKGGQTLKYFVKGVFFAWLKKLCWVL